MPKSCCICKTKIPPGGGFSFHRFPRDKVMEKKWLDAINKKISIPGEATRLCGKHFTEDDYKIGGLRRQLTKDAVPSIFEAPNIVLHQTPEPKQTRIVSESKVKVEFKPEMWEDRSQDSQDEAPAKRAKLRLRKLIHDKARQEEDVIVKSEVVPCCALACPNTSETHIMNCLPRDPILQQHWVSNIDRIDWTPDPDSALCEVHFEAEMWEHDLDEEKILRLDAVPTLYLHGEVIKSWVTMDHSGNVENVIVGGQSSSGGSEEWGTFEEEEADCFIKHEALVPEIDMVEGSETSRDMDMMPSGDQFETIYCDSTFDEQEEESSDGQEHHFKFKREPDSEEYRDSQSEARNPLEPDSAPSEDDSMNPIIQDEEVSCINDALDKPELRKESKFLVISKPDFLQRKIRRRSSSQLTEEFKCPICERRLSRKKNLEIHMEKLHPNGEISEYQKRKKVEQKLLEEEAERKRHQKFKKPPPGLTPIVTKCLFTPGTHVVSSSHPHPALIPLASSSLSTPGLAFPTFTTIPSIGTVPSLTAIPSLQTSAVAISQTIVGTPSIAATPTIVAVPNITEPPAPRIVETLTLRTIPSVGESSALAITPSISANFSSEATPQALSPDLQVIPTTIISAPPTVAVSSTVTIPTSGASSSTVVSTSTGGSIPTETKPSLKRSKMTKSKDLGPGSGDGKKQFLLLLPKAQSPSAATEDPLLHPDESQMYSVNLASVPLENRVVLKRKLKELVDAVITKDLDPDKIIIAYDRT